MPADARATLAADQGRLVAALSGRADVPPGFDRARVRLAAQTLLAKRRKGVAYTWPRLAQLLGDRFGEHFLAFAAESSPHPAGPAADGLAFARWLDGHGSLPDAIAPDFIRGQLCYGRRFIGLASFRAGNRLWLGIRLPAGGVRVLSVPWRC